MPELGDGTGRGMMSELDHDQRLRMLALDLISSLPDDEEDALSVIEYMGAEYRNFVMKRRDPVACPKLTRLPGRADGKTPPLSAASVLRFPPLSR